MYNLSSDERLVIVKRWINTDSYDIYVFTVNSKGLKKKDFKDNKTRNVFIIEKSIYHDDNIKSVRNKIVTTFDIQSDSEVYMYTLEKIDEDHRLYMIKKFLDCVYGGGIKQKVLIKTINNYFKEHFHIDNDKAPIKYKNDDDMLSYESAFMKLQKHKIECYKLPLSFNLLNTKQKPIMFVANPYKALLNEDEVLYKRHIIHDFQDLNDLISFNLPKDLCIHVVTKDDVEEYGKEHFKTSRDYILDLYFPSEIQTIKLKKESIINKIDSIKNGINEFEFNSIVDSIQNNVILCKLIVNAIKPLNLSRIFNTFQVRETVPFTSYKTRTRQYSYRLLKHNLHHIVDRTTFNKWIEIERKSITSRKEDVLSFKVRFKESKTYATVSVKDTGDYYVKFYFGSFKVTYDELMDFVKVMNKTILSEIGLEPILFHINTRIEDLRFNTMITTKVSISTEKEVVKNLSNNPFFTNIKGTNNEYMLRYKRVASYSLSLIHI